MRSGTLLALRDGDGHVGLGEATPLDYVVHIDTQIGLQRFATAALPLEIPDDADARAVHAIARTHARSPSGRFAIEVAIGDLLARRRGISLARWWSPRAVASLPVAIVVDSWLPTRAPRSRPVRAR